MINDSRFVIFGKVWCKKCHREQRKTDEGSYLEASGKAQNGLAEGPFRVKTTLMVVEEHAAYCPYIMVNGKVSTIATGAEAHGVL